MSKKTAVHSPPTSNWLSPSDLTQIITTHRLSRNIETAHQNGALFFLATHLRPLLKEFHQKNGTSSPIELETLIVQAARMMLDE